MNDKSRHGKENFLRGIKRFLQKNPQAATFLGFICIILIFSRLSPNFLTKINISNIVNQSASIAIVALGMTMVLLTGGIDLSIGGILALVCVVVAKLFSFHVPLLFILLAGFLLGASIGFVNGLIITRFSIQPFLVTMGMVSITRGLAQYMTNGQSIFINADNFREIVSQSTPFDIPVLVYWLVLLLMITYFLVSHTPFGRRMQAVGGNPEAAAFSGIKVTQVKLIVYTMNGLLAAAAGFVTLSRLSSGLPTVAQGIEMDAIASAVLGGTGFNGEGGNILGTVLGSLVIATITNGLTVLGVDSYLQNVVKGVIIILTVVVSVSLAKKGER